MGMDLPQIQTSGDVLNVMYNALNATECFSSLIHRFGFGTDSLQ